MVKYTPLRRRRVRTHTYSINQTIQYAKTNETPGKYIQKKKKQENPVFSSSLFAWKKLKEKTATVMGREKK
jgi:hypothetical protein